MLASNSLWNQGWSGSTYPFVQVWDRDATGIPGNPVNKINYSDSKEWWHVSIVLNTREDEVGELLELKTKHSNHTKHKNKKKTFENMIGLKNTNELNTIPLRFSYLVVDNRHCSALLPRLLICSPISFILQWFLWMSTCTEQEYELLAPC